MSLAAAAQAQAPVAAQPPVHVFAAGSLREVFTEVAAAYEARSGGKVALTFGASGLLRERIDKGERPDVFASADTVHPQRLANGAQWKAPVVFTHNGLCALTSAAINATPDTVLDTLLRPNVRVGTSTPKSDPAGDYAWALFERAEALRPGARDALGAKALKLTGGADSAQAPAGQGTYAWLMSQDRADVFITYCTNAVSARRELPALKVVAMPAALQVGAAYALTVREAAPEAASAFARYVLTDEAQAVFRRLGFGAP
ncbi:molybdate ABC transporter substrate-binding protein [soil metagenome]